MIPKTLCLVIALKFSIVFLSSSESLFPNTIRRVSQSCVGVFPLLICPGGFYYFPIAKISHHYRREIISDEISPKLRNYFHSQIWDPGISNFSFSWSNNSTASLIVLGSGLNKVLIFTDDDGDTCKFWVVTFSSLERTYRSQSHVYFPNLFCLWYKHKQRHESLISRSGFHCLVRVTRIQVISFCLIYIVHSNETHRCSLMATWVISYGTIRRLCKVTTFILMRMKKMDFNGLGNNTAPLRISKYFGYKRHDPEPLQATYRSIRLIRVMRKAFRSFIYTMIALYKYMRRGLNRFYLLPVRLLLESRVTSTSSSKLGFNFLYLFHWLYSNGFLYHVSCKHFMKKYI